MSYFDPKGLYRISSANRSQSLMVNTDKNFPLKEPNFVFQQQDVVTGGKRSTSYTMGPITKFDTQLWTFIPASNGFWTIHNYSNDQPDKKNPKKSISYEDVCLERNEINLQLAVRNPKEARQLWYIQSTDDGEGKWTIQTEMKKRDLGTVAPQLDIKISTNQVLVTNGAINSSSKAFPGENICWEIEYVKPIASQMTSRV